MNNTNPFIIDFKNELEKIKNKTYLIENEIRQIELYISTNYIPQSSQRGSSVSITNVNTKTNSVFQLNYSHQQIKEKFNTYFNQNLLGESFTPEKIKNDRWGLKDVYIEANHFAKYYEWLKKLKNKPNSNQNTSKLTLNQKVLALHYLGLDLKKYDRTKSSNILSQIIGEDESNTRKSLNYINSATKEDKVKNKLNLKKLIELFKNEQFDKIKSTIKDDLKKVEVSD